MPSRCSGVCSHSKMDEAEGLLQCFLFGVFVVVVSLFIKLCDVLHHLKTQGKTLIQTDYPQQNECMCVCVCCVVYPVLVGEAPDPSSHFHSEDDEQEEEELNKKASFLRVLFCSSFGNMITLIKDITFLVPLTVFVFSHFIHKKKGGLTSPSMHGDSLMAPQHPRKPTTIIRAPAAIRMYTPATTHEGQRCGEKIFTRVMAHMTTRAHEKGSTENICFAYRLCLLLIM